MARSKERAGNGERASALIGRVYDAALDPMLWPETLTSITDAVGGAQAMMGVHDFAGAPSVIAPRMAPDLLDQYRYHWGQSDILWQRTNRAPIGQVLFAERYVSREEFTRTSLYNEWHRQLRIGVAGIGVNLFMRDGVPALCGFKRPSRDDEFDPDEIALFKLLAPHLVRAVEIQRRLGRASLALEADSAAGRRNADCTILVDAAGKIVHADAGAKRILDAHAGLRVEHGRISALERSATSSLRQLIAACASPDVGDHGPGGSLEIRRPKEYAPLKVEIAPFLARPDRPKPDWLDAGTPKAVLMIFEPTQAPALDCERLMLEYGLTPTEAKLAQEIVRGDGREAAAARLGISTGTARTHLMRIFEKTNVKRQAELVRLILGRLGSPNDR